jgi:hypothetical protein
MFCILAWCQLYACVCLVYVGTVRGRVLHAVLCTPLGRSRVGNLGAFCRKCRPLYVGAYALARQVLNDGTNGEFPRYTLLANNWAHDVGIIQKQSSFYFQARRSPIKRKASMPVYPARQVTSGSFPTGPASRLGSQGTAPQLTRG